jgi:hypothetical protein
MGAPSDQQHTTAAALNALCHSLNQCIRKPFYSKFDAVSVKTHSTTQHPKTAHLLWVLLQSATTATPAIF